MAAAIATPSIPDNRFQFSAGSKYFVVGNITISANPATYTTGGIACSFLGISEFKATRIPLIVIIKNQTGYAYEYIPGVDASSGLLKIFVQDATATNPLAEMANGTTIPAAVSGDTIQFFAIFTGME